MQTDGQTHKTKLTVAWRNFEQASNGYAALVARYRQGEGEVVGEG